MAQSADDQELMELSRSARLSGYAAGVPTGAVAADPDAITTWQQRRAAQREAYGQFVAADLIHIAGVPTFAKGQQVPLEHVIRFNLEDEQLVVRVANPEQARAGKVFESEEDFIDANPHLSRLAPAMPEAHPDALDPRGAGAALDTEGRHVSGSKGKKSEPVKSAPAKSPAGKEAA
jgi:hypothetical protein